MYTKYSTLSCLCNDRMQADDTHFLPLDDPAYERNISYQEFPHGRFPITMDSSYRYYRSPIREPYTPPEQQSCKIGGGCGENKNLLPILDPLFNVKEVTKQLILLEDHLSHEGKRCFDCILKHSLAIEGFLEEAVQLDKKGEHSDYINAALTEFRQIQREIITKVRSGDINDKTCCKISQDLRSIRKKLMPHVVPM